MIVDLAQLVRQTRLALDEDSSAEKFITESDERALSLDRLIASKMEDAVRRVQSGAPVELLERGHTFGDALCWTSDGCGWVELPDDFMRLVVFEMSDWERPVFSTITAGSAEYAMQRSRFAGIRGCAQRPVCAVVTRAEGKALEFYSCKDSTATVVQAAYLPYPKIKDGKIDICPLCRTAIVYKAAALTLNSLGEAQQAQVMDQLSNEALT